MTARTCANCVMNSACPYHGALDHGYMCPVTSKTCFWTKWTGGNCYDCSDWDDVLGCGYRGDVTLMGRLMDAWRRGIKTRGASNPT